LWIAPRTSRSSSTVRMTGLATVSALLARVAAEELLDPGQLEPVQAHDAGFGPEHRRHDPERLGLVFDLHDHPGTMDAVHAAPLRVGQEAGSRRQAHVHR